MFKFKYMLYMVFALFLISSFSVNVFAMKDYGVYCEYGFYDDVIQSDSFISIKLVVDYQTSKVEFDRGIIEGNRHDLENVFGIPLEGDRPSGGDQTIFDENILNWLKKIGFVDETNNFTCPSNPFSEKFKEKGIGNIGMPITKECNDAGCSIHLIPDNSKTYLCVYNGVSSGNSLHIKYIRNNDGLKLEILKPDGTNQTLVNNQVTDYPSPSCEDVYFTYSDNKFHVSTYTNSNINDSITLYNLCQKYNQDDIEHFCSGDCKIEEMVCSSTMIDWDKIEENCDGIIGQDMLDFLDKIFGWIQIIAPIFVIIMGGVDLTGSILQDDKDALKKATSKFIKRLIIAVALFFIPMVLDLLLEIFNEVTGAGSSSCNLGR